MSKEEFTCQCLRCLRDRGEVLGVLPVEMTRMIVCPTCGNKRCPHSDWHGNAFTGSNEPGQPGSRYPGASQPAPVPIDGPAIWDLVIADMRERDRIGLAKYGTRLQADNGRDHLQDAYEEALDLAVYLKSEIEKRKERP